MSSAEFCIKKQLILFRAIYFVGRVDRWLFFRGRLDLRRRGLSRTPPWPPRRSSCLARPTAWRQHQWKASMLEGTYGLDTLLLFIRSYDTTAAVLFIFNIERDRR